MTTPHADDGEVVGWLDCSSGVSGDMLLGALHDIGALDASRLPELLGVDATVTVEQVTRAGLAATHVVVTPAGEQPMRSLADVASIIERAGLPDVVRRQAEDVFRRLAEAEADVHGVGIEEVHFHEVGAVDAIIDVVGACLGIHQLGLDRLTVSTIAIGGGRTSAAHGSLPVPVPAVARLLAGAELRAAGGPIDRELATPTGVAVIATLADGTSQLPAMRVRSVGTGAGSADPPTVANVLRLMVGRSDADGHAGDGEWLLLEANVDDLDPRLWSTVIDRLLDAGAADAWLTPILMKKGRPAHTLGVLVSRAAAAGVRDVMFRESSTIGIRETVVRKHALDREWVQVAVRDQTVRVKVARRDGAVVNISPEWEDVAAAAAVLGLPAKRVLAEATAAAVAIVG